MRWIAGGIVSVVIILGLSGCGNEDAAAPTPPSRDMDDTLAPTPTPRAEPQFSPYTVFQNLSPAELETVQIKLTHVGAQRKPIATVVADTAANELDLARFVDFRRPGFNYGNDETSLVVGFELEANQIGLFIDSLTAFPSITAGDVDALPRLSLAMIAKTASGENGFEAIVSNEDAKNVLDTLFSSASPSNNAAIDALKTQWIQLNLGIGPLNPDVDGDGLSEIEEKNTYGTDPSNPDSDFDGFSDGAEVLCGSNPLDESRGCAP